MTDTDSIYQRIREIVDMGMPIQENHRLTGNYPYPTIRAAERGRASVPRVNCEPSGDGGTLLAIGLPGAAKKFCFPPERNADVTAIAKACSEHEVRVEKCAVMDFALSQVAALDNLPPTEFIRSAKEIAIFALAEVTMDEIEINRAPPLPPPGPNQRGPEMSF